MDPNSFAPLAGYAGSAPAPAPDQGAGPSDLTPEGILQTILQLATLYRAQESDHGDLLKMERATTLVQQILADRQSQHDQLIGGNGAALRRALGAG